LGNALRAGVAAAHKLTKLLLRAPALEKMGEKPTTTEKYQGGERN
jgi:hypothetical protein